MAGYGSQEGRIVFFVRGEVAEPASGEIVEGAREGGARAVRVTRSEGVGGGGSERGPEEGRGWGGSYILSGEGAVRQTRGTRSASAVEEGRRCDAH